MLNVYRKCLNLWILYNYREIIRDRNAGSLKLLLKARNAKFLKYLYTVIFHCEGTSSDPLIQFLLFLINITSNPPKAAQEQPRSPVSSRLKSEESNIDETPQSVISLTNTNDKNKNKDKNKDKNKEKNKDKNRDKNVGNDGLNNETSDPEVSKEVVDDEIEAYKVFIDVFLSSLVPILLYTYYHRVSTKSQPFDRSNSKNYEASDKYNDEPSDKYNYSSGENHFRVEKLTKLSRTRVNNNKCNIFKSFLNDEERLLNRVNSHNNFLNYLKDAGEYPSNFYPNQPNPVTKGIEIVLFKLSLLNLRGNNTYKIPSSMCDIYNRLNNSTLKKQLETSLLYCYRLRCNDLYFKSNNVKLLSKILTTNTTSYSLNSKHFDKDLNFTNLNIQANDFELSNIELSFENYAFDMNTVTGSVLRLFNHYLNYIYKVMYNNTNKQMTLNYDKYIKFLYKLICSNDNETLVTKSTNTFEYIYRFLLKFIILYSSRRTIGYDSHESNSTTDSELNTTNYDILTNYNILTKYNILARYNNLSSDYSIGDCGNIKLLMLVINYNLLKHNSGILRKFKNEILKMLNEMKFDMSNLNLYYLVNCHYKLINYKFDSQKHSS